MGYTECVQVFDGRELQDGTLMDYLCTLANVNCSTLLE